MRGLKYEIDQLQGDSDAGAATLTLTGKAYSPIEIRAMSATLIEIANAIEGAPRTESLPRKGDCLFD